MMEHGPRGAGRGFGGLTCLAADRRGFFMGCEEEPAWRQTGTD